MSPHPRNQPRNARQRRRTSPCFFPPESFSFLPPHRPPSPAPPPPAESTRPPAPDPAASRRTPRGRPARRPAPTRRARGASESAMSSVDSWPTRRIRTSRRTTSISESRLPSAVSATRACASSSVHSARQSPGRDAVERAQDLPLGEALVARSEETARRKQARVLGSEDRLDAEKLGDPAGVLTAGTAERHQRVGARIEALTRRDVADRRGHALVGDRQPVEQEILDRHSGGGGQLVRPSLGGAPIDRYFEAVHQQPAEQEVGVGHRQRSASPVAGRTRIGTGAARTDRQPRPVEPEDRSPSGGDGRDRDRRHDHLDLTDAGREAIRRLPVGARDVGRSAAHVEAENRRKPGRPADLDRPENTARRTRKQALGAAKTRRRHETTGAGQEPHGRRGPRPELPRARRSRREVAPDRRRPRRFARAARSAGTARPTIARASGIPPRRGVSRTRSSWAGKPSACIKATAAQS